jgi:hypothetical protein
MSNRSSRISAASRAEARRRARYLAQGRDPGEGEEPEANPEPGSQTRVGGGTFLSRLFPAAPPLPGKPDPLAGFGYTGPLRGVVECFYLLSQRPLIWGSAGVAWAVARLVTELGGNSLTGVMASLVSFGSLIAAGWIGWQRPWLYGLAASVLGMLIYAGIWTSLLSGRPGVPAGEVALFLLLLYREGFQPFFGALAGWYGGYLRRRMVAAPAQARNARRR